MRWLLDLREAAAPHGPPDLETHTLLFLSLTHPRGQRWVLALAGEAALTGEAERALPLLASQLPVFLLRVNPALQRGRVDFAMALWFFVHSVKKKFWFRNGCVGAAKNL